MKILIATSLVLGCAVAQHERSDSCKMVDCSGRCVPDGMDQFMDTVGRLLGDGVCDDGVKTRFDFDCEIFAFDHGDCARMGGGMSDKISPGENHALDALAKDPKNFDLLKAYVEARPESPSLVKNGVEKLYEEARLKSFGSYRDSVTEQILGGGEGKAGDFQRGMTMKEEMKMLKELQKKLQMAEGKGEGKAWEKEQSKIRRQIESLRKSMKKKAGKDIDFDLRKDILAVQEREDLSVKEKKRLVAEIVRMGKEEVKEKDEGLPGENAGRRTTERKLGLESLDPEMTLGRSIKHRKHAEIRVSREEEDQEN